ncbi:HTH domain-containing protein [Ilyomonas limi]|uniref:HTH domain-containing protein n=1 Tax=Ilyomonas limi TaxID=2575867 RepID=A0A4U3KX03_9BACT|nr:S24 family peptidase [Ilyomonas limi]TKK66369.1 HTH domain-containing protein [Ilyomonas limi]
MKDLHSSQEKLLKLLKGNIEFPLTMRELQEQLELASPSVVHHHLQQLEKKGYLKRNPNNSKDYIIMDDPEKAIVYINKYGLAQCGPDGTMLSCNPIDRIPIASRLLKFPAEEAFIVEAKGNSMEPKIKNGDLVIAQMQNHAKNGEIVVCVNNRKVLIKQFIKSGKNIILHSLNSEEYHPFIAEEDLKIEGIVKNTLQYE